jgi:hypothetical protein
MNNTNFETEPYMYVIVVLGPIIGFLALSICIKYVLYFCHGGSRIYKEDESYDY